MMEAFNPANWFWFVGGDTSRAYSSKAKNYVPADNPDFVAWLDAGGMPTAIDTEASLGTVLAPYQLEPIPRGIHKGYAAEIDRLNGAKLSYTKQVNPALNAQPAKTAAQILGV